MYTTYSAVIITLCFTPVSARIKHKGRERTTARVALLSGGCVSKI